MKSEVFRNEKNEVPLTAEAPEGQKILCVSMPCGVQSKAGTENAIFRHHLYLREIKGKHEYFRFNLDECEDLCYNFILTISEDTQARRIADGI